MNGNPRLGQKRGRTPVEGDLDNLWSDLHLSGGGGLKWHREAAEGDSCTIARPQIELLERRLLLSSAAIGVIPGSIDPASATQLLLAPGTSEWTIPADPSGPASRLFRFTSDSDDFAAPVQFDLAPLTLAGSGDAALALYDENGNLLQAVDADEGEVPGIETLAAAVQSHRPYILGVYFGPSGPPVDYQLLVQLDQQVLNVGPVFDPATGLSVPTGSAPEDILSTPADVDYYPLALLNAGPSGTVSITPTGLDVKVAATLFRLEQDMWNPIASGADAGGGAVVLSIAPPAEQSLADGQYLLTVASHDFASAGAYEVAVNAAPVLGPATLPSLAGLVELRTPPPVSLGVAGVDEMGSLAIGGQRLYRFRAPTTGAVEISLQSAAFDPVVGIYDSSGGTLLAVGSRTVPGTTQMSFSAQAGAEYVIRIGDVGNNHGGSFSLSLRTAYEPAPLTLSGPITTLPAMPVGPGSAHYLRVQPGQGIDALVLSSTATGAATTVVTVGENDDAAIFNFTAGQSLFVPLNVREKAGAFDVFIGAASSASGTLNLQVGQVSVPKTLPLDHFSIRKPDPATGNLPASSQSAGAFGNLTGVQFFQPLIEPGQASDLSVQGLNGARPLLAQYRQQGSSLMLVDIAVPEAHPVTGWASMHSAVLGANHVHAVAAMALSMDGSGVHQFNVNGPPLMTVGVGMVPDPPPPTWQDDPADPPFFSALKIRDIEMKFDYEQDLWHTLLPQNLTGLPVVSFIPADGSGPAAKITVYKDSFTSPTLWSFTNTPGQQAQTVLSGVTVDSLQGARILFRVEPLTGQLGDGIYTLEMTVETTNPAPFELREDHWINVFDPPSPLPPGQVGVIPFATLKELVQDQHGFGSALDSMTSSTPNTTNSVDIYRFQVQTPGPVTIRTKAIPFIGSPLGANTNIKLYRPVLKPDGSFHYLTQVEDVPVSFDWFPADRSEIDAQIHIADFDLLGTTGWYYVVVKNQEGSTGLYQIEVETPPFPSLGGSTTYIPTTGGSATISGLNVESSFEFTGYFPVQMPDYHNGTLTVTSAPLLAHLNADWRMHLFTADGTRLDGTISYQSTAAGDRTIGTFTVPPGAQTVYLRLREVGNIPNDAANFNLSASVTLPPGLTAPETTFVPQPAFPLPTDPFAGLDGFTDSMTSLNQQKRFAFRAAAGPMTVNITPEMVGGDASVILRWAVYVDGTLRAWDQTQVVDGQLVEESLTTTLLLPQFRSTTPVPYFSFDRSLDNPYHDVVIVVRAMSAPIGGGNYSISIDSPRPLPMMEHNKDVALSPTVTNPSATTTLRGIEWFRLSVPDGISGNVNFLVQFLSGSPSANTPVRYDIYDGLGQFVASGTTLTFSQAGQIRASFSPPQVTGGSMYHIRVAVAAEAVNANAFVNMTITASASLPKATTLPPLLNHGLLDQNIRPAFPMPDGQFTFVASPLFNPPDPNHPTLQESNSIWVETGGPAQIRVPISSGTVAVYRGVGEFSGEFPVQNLYLVDYTNSPDPANPGFFVLNLFLDPGMYAVKVFRPAPVSFSVAINYSLPAFPVQDLVLDPNFGTSDLPHLNGATTAATNHSKLESFRTVFYRMISPAGSLGPFNLSGYQLSSPSFPETLFGFIDVLKGDGAGGATSLGFGSGGVVAPPPSVITEFNTVMPVETGPFEEYYVRVTRYRLAGKTAAGVTFAVPFSGTPDLVVGEVNLLPDNGQTRVEVQLFNIGYAPAGLSHSRFTTTDTSKSPVKVTDAILTELPMGPISSRLKVFTWIPMRPEDKAAFTADLFDSVEELDETNNHQDKLLSTVNKFRPVVTVGLADPQMDGHPNPNTWGRYLADVDAITDVVINISDGDGPHDLYNGRYVFPQKLLTFFGNDTQVVLKDVNFGQLLPTGPNNANQFKVYARDRFGLLSDEIIITIDVKPFPAWLDDGMSSIVFNYQTRQYDFHFTNTLLDQGGTINSLTGANIPFIGDKDNIFKAEINAIGSASLNPNTPVSAPVTGYVLIKILGATVLEETWAGQGQINNHLQLSTNVQVDSKTVEATQLNVTFRLMNLNLFNWTSPKITLFAYGVPGVASINAFLQFSIGAQVDAAITLALDPAALQNPLLPKKIGLASPTFIEPSLTAGLTIGGSVEVIGFDIASITGTVNFKLALAYGLTTPPSQFVEFIDFFANSNLNITGTLWGTIKAKLLGFTIMTFDFPSVVMNFTGGPPVIKSTNLLDSLVEIAALETELSTLMLSNMPEPVTPGGNDPVGPMELAPSPNIAIDPATGHGRYVQVVDTDGGAEVHGNLAVSTRTGSAGAWSGETILTSAGHVSNPVLALTNDGPNAPAVVVYQSLTPSGNLSSMTRNQFLTGQDLRYRYFNGTSWSAEQAITSDSFYDFDHAVAFNNSGQGVLAWVRNTSAAPIDNQGMFNRDANEIMASIWNPVTHTWSVPVALTNDTVADGKPAVYVDENGRLYVLWLKDTPAGNQIMFRTYEGGFWTAAAVLPVAGLPADGKIGSLAFGSQQPGRINVLMSHSRTDPVTGEMHSRLYSRASTLAGFAQSNAVVEVARDATFSHLRTTNAPDGALVAYWQHSNGVTNEVYAAHLNGSGIWSRPVRLSADAELSFTPSLAIDTDGTYQLVYEMQEAPKIGFWDEVPAPEPLVSPPIGLPANGGVVTGSLEPLPEFGFAREMFFLEQDDATSGQTATGRATIINSGIAADDVLVEFLHGELSNATIVGSVLVQLEPGSTYDAAHAFAVNPGENQYHIRLTAAGGAEAISTDDNLSSASLTGRPDVEIDALRHDSEQPLPGDTIGLVARVRNNSDQALSGVRVGFYHGDPHSSLAPAVLFDEVVIDLNPFEVALVEVPWTVPAGAGHHAVTAWADHSEVIAESNEFNNWAYLNFSALPDPAVLDGPVAFVLNYSGVDNVGILTNVGNVGQATVQNVRVALLWSLDDDDFEQVGLFVIPSLAAGENAIVPFITDGLTGLTGHNRYRVIVDPGMEHPDADWSNNVAETLLIIHDLPDLAVEEFTLVPDTDLKQGMQDLRLMARIHNLGIATAQNITVEVLAHPGGAGFIPGHTGIVIGKIVIDQLDPLSFVDIVIPLDASQLAGPYEIALIIDRQQQILEKTDQNNVVSERFIFASDRRAHEGSRTSDDTWYVRLGDDGRNELIQVWHNRPTNQPPSFVYLPSQVTALNFFGLGGTNRLTVDFSMGDPIPGGGLLFAGGLDFDRLVVLGTSADDVMLLNPGQLAVNGSVISFSSVEHMVIETGSGNDTLTVTGNVPEFFFAGGSGNNTLNLRHGTFRFGYNLGSVSDNLTVNVRQSAVEFATTQHLARLSITDSQPSSADAPEPLVHLLPSDGRTTNVLVTGSLEIAPAARLDLANNAMIVNYAGPNPLDQINNWLITGRAGGDWDGFGIMSSEIGRDSRFALGIGDNDVLRRTVFAGQPAAEDAILVRYTLSGDFNLDLRVDGEDFLIWQANFGTQNGAYWYEGDANFDRRVDGEDFLIWQANFGAVLTGTAAAAAEEDGVVSYVSDPVDAFTDSRPQPKGLALGAGGRPIAHLPGLPVQSRSPFASARIRLRDIDPWEIEDHPVDALLN